MVQAVGRLAAARVHVHLGFVDDRDRRVVAEHNELTPACGSQLSAGHPPHLDLLRDHGAHAGGLHGKQPAVVEGENHAPLPEDQNLRQVTGPHKATRELGR